MTKVLALILTVGALAACTSNPLTPTPRVSRYVVVGDSVGLGAQWPIVEAAIPGTWTNASVGSTFIHTQWQPGGSAFLAMHATVLTTPTAFLAHLGANDTVLQPPPTEASVFADLQRLVTGLTSTYPGAVIYLAEVGQVWTYGDKRVENAAVRSAIARAWHELPSVRQGPLMQDLTPDDGVHFTSPANVQTIAARWIAVLRP